MPNVKWPKIDPESLSTTLSILGVHVPSYQLSPTEVARVVDMSNKDTPGLEV